MHRDMARKVNKHHYVASPPRNRDLEPVHIGYSTDGEDSQYAASASASARQHYQRQASPASSRQHYQRQASPASSRQHYAPHGQRLRRDDDGSDIYVTSAAYRAPSELSRYSDAVSVKSKKSRKGALTVETMSAPNPFCPNTRGICCLMLLLNLGIILVTLGFIIVIQFHQPVFVWILGVVFLVFGFLTLIGSLLYCVHVCRDARAPSQLRPEDLYWTRHWQKTIGPPEIHYQPQERVADRYETQSHRSNGRY